MANGISSPCVPVDIRSFYKDRFAHWEAWAQLIGSLADGDLWVLGPNGPIPVDPWAEKYKEAAVAARKQALEGLLMLQNLGVKIAAERKKESDMVEGAPDEGSEEGEKMEAQAKERMRKAEMKS